MINSIGLFRSVIVNNNNKIISFSPPKSFNYESFKNKHKQISDVTIEEYIEGTMINLFWNQTEWDISTKSTVGAKIIFFQNEDKLITFRHMFNEVCNDVNLQFDSLNEDYCYSFVMQHPKNRIVIPLYDKKLYLVKVFKLDNEKYKIYDVDKLDIYTNYFKDTKVELPIKKKYDSYESLTNEYSTMNTPYDILGLMLYSKNGDRSKIRNPSYEYVRKLRGNQPKLLYEYLSLRKTGKMKDFLKYYPEYKNQFNEYRQQLHQYTTTLYINYVNCYMNKEKPLIEYPTEYRTNMFHLHKNYIDNLKDNKKHVNFKLVCEYVNDLHQSQQMHCLNYNIKKHFLDCLKIDDTKNNDN
jgi:hypothetical protein